MFPSRLFWRPGLDHREIEQGVCEVFSTVLERKIPTGEQVERSSEPRWDSLKHIELVFSVEEKFDVQFSEQEMSTLDTLSKMTEAVRTHLETRDMV